MSAEIIRLRFAFTVTFRYLFPQLTMGLALLVVLKLSLCAQGVPTGIALLNSGDEYSE
jgi:cytochrome bd-type quinol oxidase subunit 1